MLGAVGSLPSTPGPRILAFRSGALGDTLLALPALAALRVLAGASGSLDFVGSEPAARLVLGPRHAAAVHSADRALFAALHHQSADDRELASFLGRFDLVVAWSRLPLLRPKLAELGIPSIDADPLPPAGVHAADHLYRSLSPLGISGPAPAPVVEPDAGSLAAALAFLEQSGLRPGEFVAVHPSSGSSRKNWPRERFHALALLILEERKLLWIAGEADRAVVPLLERSVPAPVARELPLETLAAVLSLGLACVGNDSGVTHLAAAVGVPTVAMFGPTDPSLWAPRGKLAVVADFGTEPMGVWEKARSLSRSR